MTRFFSILFVSLLAALSLNAQPTPASVELKRLLNEFLDGAGRNDAAVHDRFWDEQLIYTRSAGVRVNKEELMKGVRSAPARKESDPVTVYKAEDVRILEHGTTAVVAFKLVGTTTRADGTKTVSNHLNTGTFVNRDGKWRVIAWQATTIPDPKPETKPASPSDPKPETKPSAAEAKPKTLVMNPAPPPPVPGRTYTKGSRGGCYYLNSKGAKVYVDKSYCG